MSYPVIPHCVEIGKQHGKKLMKNGSIPRVGYTDVYSRTHDFWWICEGKSNNKSCVEKFFIWVWQSTGFYLFLFRDSLLMGKTVYILTKSLPHAVIWNKDSRISWQGWPNYSNKENFDSNEFIQSNWSTWVETKRLISIIQLKISPTGMWVFPLQPSLVWLHGTTPKRVLCCSIEPGPALVLASFITRPG